jgi:hydrophobe/amphiphile efflux-1 (HAE1) family protein
VALGIILFGSIAYRLLPSALLPAVDLPTLQVTASLPGASPKSMATTVAAPLERKLGRIAGATDVSSYSTFGATSVVVQFELGHDIDAAARDVQAAINAAANDLPSGLPYPPTIRKSNPAMAPLLFLALTSDTLPPDKVFEYAKTVVAQKLSQIEGVGSVWIDGAEKSAIRVSVNPAALASLGLGLDDVRVAITEATTSMPRGSLDGDVHTAAIAIRNPLGDADGYRSLVIAYRDGAPVRLRDVASVGSGSADSRVGGWFNDRRAVFVVLMREPGANLVATVERVRAVLPQLRFWMPPGIDVGIVADRSGTVRDAVAHVELTLAISVALVTLVIFLFLRRVWVTLIPAATIPVSLAGAIGLMWLFGNSIDILSLMALTVSVGFVVDDTIVMVENITRHGEAGQLPLQATLIGARQVAFTIISITAALIAALIPLLFMPGIVGRFLQEFALTLASAIVISAVVSLTLAPALLARSYGRTVAGQTRSDPRSLNLLLQFYSRSLRWALAHKRSVLILTLTTCAATVMLYLFMPKGLTPSQDLGVIAGVIDGTQDASPVERERRQREVTRAIMADPAVKSVASAILTWGNWLYVDLKPLQQRGMTADQVAERLKARLSHIPGVTTHLHPVQDFWLGGLQGYSQYQYTLQSENWDELSHWVPIVREKLRGLPELRDVSTYQESRGLEAELQIERDRGAQLGVSPKLIEETLYDAFGQRQIAMLYGPTEQFPIVFEVAADRQDLEALQRLFIKSADGAQIPLDAVTRAELGTAPLSISHRSQLPYATLAFNVAPGTSLSDAIRTIRTAEAELRLPGTLRSEFDGQAQAFRSSAASIPILILTAIMIIYIVLGVLYESYIHPLTILSTVPTAGLGALLTLLAFRMDLSLVAFIGIVLLIGIVAKNAIMVVDFALDPEHQADSSEEAIFKACLLRFRPIIMTTATALLGALPLALAAGPSSDFYRPLGIAIAGGLIVSQLLTLYTTPIIYLYLDRLHRRSRSLFPAILHPLTDS